MSLRQLRRTRERFLDSCRNLAEGRSYWKDVAGWKRWLLGKLVPVPLASLFPEGARLYEALERLEDQGRRVPLGLDSILEYHRILFPPTGGRFRTGPVAMRDSTVLPPPAARVPALMAALHERLAGVQERWDRVPPARDEVLREAMHVYQLLGKIHPFPDGNGRVARLSLNHLLRRTGHPYVILPPLSESPDLMAALQDGHRGNLDPLVAIAAASLHEA